MSEQYRNFRKIRGTPVRAKNETIGKVDDYLFDEGNWTVRYIVVDTGNWLRRRLVLIAPVSIDSFSKPGAPVRVNLTKEEIGKSPPIERHKPVSMRVEDKITNYYRWPRYWSGMEYGDGTVVERSSHPVGEEIRPSSEMAPGREDEMDSRLHSANEVLGYKLDGTDRAFGEVFDFVIDVFTWRILLLVCDTSRWLPGRMVVLPPEEAKAVHWEKQQLLFDLSESEIKDSPEYRENQNVDGDLYAKVRVFFNRLMSRF